MSEGRVQTVTCCGPSNCHPVSDVLNLRTNNSVGQGVAGQKASIRQYVTKCGFCETEEEFISTSDQVTCGGCGKETQIISSAEIGQKKDCFNGSND